VWTDTQGVPRRKLDPVEPVIIIALITSVTSITVAVAGVILAYASQRRIQNIKLDHDKSLEGLRQKFADSSTERRALLDYEYDARKRLYETM
jgi:hypothetical protein